MINSLNALLPIFLVITIGMVIRRVRYLPDSVWPALDQVCWYVLFPLLIIRTLSQSDLTSVPFKGLAGALLIAITAMIILLFALKPLMARFAAMTGPGFTSFFQGTSRWNGFAALAIIQALYGEAGLVLGALSFAIMVPVLQVVNVLVLSIYGNSAVSGAGSFSSKRLATQLCKNPMLVSIALGLSLNVAGVSVSGVFETTLQMIAASALGLSLLAVGAGLKFSSLSQMPGTVILSSSLKLLVMPLLIVFSCELLGVQGLARDIAVVCGAAPTAGTAYIMARQMGGDSDMVAAIITFQTLAAVFTLPLMLSLVA